MKQARNNIKTFLSVSPNQTVALGRWMMLVLSISQSICSMGNVSREKPEDTGREGGREGGKDGERGGRERRLSKE